MHVRLVAFFSVVASVPTLLVVIFASLLFQSGVQFWFSDRARTILAPCCPQFERIVGAFENAGIDRRYSVVEMDWVFGDGAAAAVLGPGDAPAPRRWSGPGCSKCGPTR